MKKPFALLIVLALAAGACSTDEDPESLDGGSTQDTASVDQADSQTGDTETSSDDGQGSAETETSSDDGQSSADTETGDTETEDGVEAAVIAVPDVLSPTPEQTEGPYYPVELPGETDNDLTTISGGTAAVGRRLELTGLVVTDDGERLPDATVEIWQTDDAGIYLHPEDPQFDRRDQNFQSYGKAVTDGNGQYAFTTVVPGVYEARPAHIHLKVIHDGDELLTSQIYFSGDQLIEGDSVTDTVGDDELDLLTTDLIADGDVLRAVHVLVVEA